MGCSGMFFPAGNMHIYCTPGTVINSGARFLWQTGHFIATFLFPHAPLLSSFLSSLTSFSGALFLLSVT